MMHDIDHSSYEIGGIQLTLRRELAFRRQSFGAEACYVIEDTVKSQFFRIGVAEYTFISLLDGRTSIAEAVAETSSQMGSDAFTESQAASLCGWLVDSGLATTPQSALSNRLADKAEVASNARKREWLNPIMLKFRLGNPDEAIKRCHLFAGWIFGTVGFSIWCVVATLGAYFAFVNWDQLSTASNLVFSTDNWLLLGITWLGLKLVHELAHGMVCRKFGGDTRETGILLLLFIPMPYVDVTSSWRFGSKWQRMFVAAAGMYAELFVAALASIAWAKFDSPMIQHHAFNIMLTAGAMTLLFNINPLMRFDGYYILSDFFEVPNLATHGQQDLRSWANRWLLGVESDKPAWPEGKGALIRAYGIGAFCWRITICVSLILGAEMLFHGAGIVLAMLALILWVIIPLAKFIRYLIVGDPVNPPKRRRVLGIATILLAAGYGIWNYVPWVERMQVAAIVDYSPVTSVRLGASGFVRSILVETGDVVSVGQPLFRLENKELEARKTEVSLGIQKSQINATQFHQQGNQAAYQVELENQNALRKRLVEIQQQLAELIVSSPYEGEVLSSNLQDLDGQWITAGSELCLLGNSGGRAMHIVVPQSSLKAVNSLRNRPVTVHIWGMGSNDLIGDISSIDPRGTTRLKYHALAAIAGGPLAVQAAKPTENSTQANDANDWQLLEPHFTGQVNLPDKQLDSFASGRTGYVEFSATRGSVGEVVKTAIQDFYGNRQSQKQL